MKDDAGRRNAPEADDELDTSAVGEEEEDGYQRTRRKTARDGGKSKATPAKEEPAGPPPTAWRRFMDEHWESWLSQVLMLLLVAGGVIGYRLELLNESMIGLVLVGGLLAITLYVTSTMAFPLIEKSFDRRLFSVVVLAWAAAAGYPTLRKAVPRKVVAEAQLTPSNKSIDVPIGEGSTGPFDITISGTLKQEAGQNATVGYSIMVSADGKSEELLGDFKTAVHQVRARRGSNQWAEQHNQVEHRLPSSLRAAKLSFQAENVDELLQSGLHIAVHPQGPNPRWFFILGALVVLCMVYFESRIGDAKNKTYLIMASASTLVFSYEFFDEAVAGRLVRPALSALFLAVIVGGIGGSLVGAVVRRVSGRYKVKPRPGESEKEAEKSEEAEAT